MGRVRHGMPIARNRAIWITDPPYNAKGDGSTDNTVAINTAITAAITANVPVFIPPGTFNHSGTLTVGAFGTPATALYGCGEASVLSATTPGLSSLNLLGAAPTIAFNFKKQILSPGARLSSNSSMAILSYFSQGAVTANVHVSGSAAAGIFTQGGTLDTVQNCVVENTNADGIMHVEPASQFHVMNCYVFNSGDDGISTANYSNDPGNTVSVGVITGNSVVGTTGARLMGINGGQSLTITGNHFDRGTGVGLQGSAEFPTLPPGPTVSFTGNTIKNTWLAGSTGSVNGGGIILYNDATFSFTGVTASGNQIINTAAANVVVTGSTGIGPAVSAINNTASGPSVTLYSALNTATLTISHTGNTYTGAALPATDLVPVVGGLNANLSLSWPQGIVAWNSGLPSAITGHADVDQLATTTTTFAAVAGATGQSSTTLTIGPNATAMLVFLMFTNNTPSSPAVVWDSGGTNQSLTNINSGQMATGQVYMFGLVKPTPGNKTLLATWTGTGTGQLFAMSFVGTLNDTVAGTFPNSVGTTPTGTTNTLTIAGGNANDLCVGAVMNNTGAYTTPLFTQLSAITVSVLASNSATDGFGQVAYATGSASTVWSSSLAGSTQVAYVGCNVVGAPA